MEDIQKAEPKLGDEIPENWLKQAESEIAIGFRDVTISKFHGKDDVDMRIHFPSTEEDSISTVYYSKAYTRLLRDPEIITRKQMKELLESRAIWTTENEKEIENLQENMRGIESEVAHIKVSGKYNKAHMNRLRQRWFSLRSEMQNKIAEKEAHFSNCLENRAEEEQLKAKLSLCVRYPDGSKVWNSFEDLQKDTDRSSVVRVLNEAVIFWMGLTQEIIDGLPAAILSGGEE